MANSFNVLLVDESLADQGQKFATLEFGGHALKITLDGELQEESDVYRPDQDGRLAQQVPYQAIALFHLRHNVLWIIGERPTIRVLITDLDAIDAVVGQISRQRGSISFRKFNYVHDYQLDQFLGEIPRQRFLDSLQHLDPVTCKMEPMRFIFYINCKETVTGVGPLGVGLLGTWAQWQYWADERNRILCHIAWLIRHHLGQAKVQRPAIQDRSALDKWEQLYLAFAPKLANEKWLQEQEEAMIKKRARDAKVKAARALRRIARETIPSPAPELPGNPFGNFHDEPEVPRSKFDGTNPFEEADLTDALSTNPFEVHERVEMEQVSPGLNPFGEYFVDQERAALPSVDDLFPVEEPEKDEPKKKKSGLLRSMKKGIAKRWRQWTNKGE